MASRATVVVVGGVNVDTLVEVQRLPTAGETVMARASKVSLGGKAANQALAAARTGTRVRLIAAVGDDRQGAAMVELLSRAQVDVSGVFSRQRHATGSAFILVDDRGENSVIVTPGANGTLDASAIDCWKEALAAADVVVVQGEIDPDATAMALEHGRRGGARLVINLAPYFDVGEMLGLADPVVLNEIEAAQLLGEDRIDLRSTAVRRLGGMTRSAVVTLGAAGALIVRGDEVRHVPAPIVETPLDTTGAGDAFVGVLAASLAHGIDLDRAAMAAVTAASRSVAVRGAGDNYPAFELMPATASEVTSSSDRPAMT